MKGIIFDWGGTLYDQGKGIFSFSEKVLKELKSKYKIGLVTIAGYGIDARKKEIESSGIKDYFDFIIIDLYKSKKHYLKCIKEMGTTPKNTFIVDDRTIRGIKIGNELGCKTVWIKKGKFSNELPNKNTGEPTYRINSIEELLKIL